MFEMKMSKFCIHVQHQGNNGVLNLGYALSINQQKYMKKMAHYILVIMALVLLHKEKVTCVLSNYNVWHYLIYSRKLLWLRPL